MIWLKLRLLFNKTYIYIWLPYNFIFILVDLGTVIDRPIGAGWLSLLKRCFELFVMHLTKQPFFERTMSCGYRH